MGQGHSEAFFEVAATLIPLLLLSGVVVDRITPPPKSNWKGWHLWFALYLPTLGALVIVAEIMALNAITTGSADTLHAVVVIVAVVLGMASVIAAVWVPWMVRYHSISPRLAVLYSAIAVFSVGGIVVYAVTPLSDTVHSASRGMGEAADQEYVARRLALEHFFATSEYRIEKLEGEAGHAVGDAYRRRVERQLRLQRELRGADLEGVNGLASWRSEYGR